MKPRERLIDVRLTSHGHYDVTVDKRGKWRRATVTDMTLIDAYHDGKAGAADKLAIIAGRGEVVA